MTSPTDTTEHPDVAEISDLAEGLLAPPRSDAVRHHVEACESCAEVRTSLEEIRDLLGAVPEPPPMPEDIAARIDAALTAEALRGTTAERPETEHAPEAAPETATEPGPATEPETVRASAGDVSRETSPAGDRPAGRPRAATGPGRNGRGRSRRWTGVALGTVLTAAVLGSGSLLLKSSGSSNDSPDKATTATAAGAFAGKPVGAQVKVLLDAERARPKDGAGTQRPRAGIDAPQDTPGSTQSANTFLETVPPVPDCVRRAAGGGTEIIGAKTGMYTGRNAYLVVTPDHGSETRVTAYVVDASCAQKGPSATGNVLLKQSYARS
ncbi:hypothetical protein KUM39_10720 [Streptomyces sp. J2-1]|uniref:zf-HC2 domain-containing protein n=1 Tax=Streptomyces corallincola TaxID=2851888 RepID=UPI001C3815DD|nr:zf-HC2 domain-containing protein [Streptomyces corallincola]MBV2354834.1 hypothetical protein [Streptomyces corallincola]